MHSNKYKIATKAPNHKGSQRFSYWNFEA